MKKQIESKGRGVIAIVFLVIGYQCATFIHHASVLMIEAKRDSPDTVYVYAHPLSRRDSALKSASVPLSVERRNNTHSPKVEAVRRKLPRKSVESFSFNPNTVSIDDLCRLGFSLKQAQSIDTYRKKGGRFSRKEDFAESFVVSDSIYRRLEQYIDIPLIDLNRADSSAFDSLPGIGPWFASKMMEHRRKLGGYSYKEQLLDIWKFDKNKYDALSDLITVSADGMIPYPLWELPADSLRMHPYIGDYAAAGIVLFRDSNPSELWTVHNLGKAGILRPEDAEKLSRCLILEPSGK